MTGAGIPGDDPLDARVRQLVAQSLAPVPPASRVAAVDVADLGMVLKHLRDVEACRARNRRPPPLSADTAAAVSRLHAVVCSRAA